mmetsp:Transcript_8669/g.18722  ORF Transcript_8669/g.18722 Transcript_8669/m.18722 type:complete len:238 (-) Transcript_8669:1977-2690(-)
MIGIRTSISTIVLLFPGIEYLVRGQNNEGRGIYLDRFTYKTTNEKNKVTVKGKDHTSIDYSPENWGDITCNEGSKLDECLGYTDKWKTGRQWDISENSCKWCPADGNHNCGRHHQSPIDLKRAVGLDFTQGSEFYSEIANECIVSVLSNLICTEIAQVCPVCFLDFRFPPHYPHVRQNTRIVQFRRKIAYNLLNPHIGSPLDEVRRFILFTGSIGSIRCLYHRTTCPQNRPANQCIR